MKLLFSTLTCLVLLFPFNFTFGQERQPESPTFLSYHLNYFGTTYQKNVQKIGKKEYWQYLSQNKGFDTRFEKYQTWHKRSNLLLIGGSAALVGSIVSLVHEEGEITPLNAGLYLSSLGMVFWASRLQRKKAIMLRDETILFNETIQSKYPDINYVRLDYDNRKRLILNGKSISEKEMLQNLEENSDSFVYFKKYQNNRKLRNVADIATIGLGALCLGFILTENQDMADYSLLGALSTSLVSGIAEINRVKNFNRFAYAYRF